MSYATATADNFFMALIAIIVVFGVPLGIYSILIIRKDWRRVYIVKRKRLIVVMLSACVMSCLLIYAPLYIASDMGIIPDDNLILNAFVLIFWVWVEQLSWWLMFSRYWLYYFDLKLTIFTNNKQWRMAIDPINESSDWFVQNINKHGNDKNVVKSVLLISIIQNILNIATALVALEVDGVGFVLYSIVRIINKMIPAFGILYLIAVFSRESGKHPDFVSNINNNGDSLGVYKELFTIALFGSGYMVCSMIFWILLSVHADEHILALLWDYFWTAVLFGYLYLIVIYPKQLFNIYNMRIRGDNMNTQVERSYNSSRTKSKNISKLTGAASPSLGSALQPFLSPFESLTMPSGSRETTGNDHDWKQGIATYHGYQSFMKHLGLFFVCLLFFGNVIYEQTI